MWHDGLTNFPHKKEKIGKMFLHKGGQSATVKMDCAALMQYYNIIYNI